MALADVHRAQVEVPRAIFESPMLEKYGPVEGFSAAGTQRNSRKSCQGHVQNLSKQ